MGLRDIQDGKYIDSAKKVRRKHGPLIGNLHIAAIVWMIVAPALGLGWGALRLEKYLRGGVGGSNETPVLPRTQDTPLPPTPVPFNESTINQWSKPYFSQHGKLWCVDQNDDYKLPSMWFKSSTTLAPQKVFVEHRVPDWVNGQNLKPFTVSLGQGNDVEYFKIFFHEGSPHLIGAAKIIQNGSNWKLDREESKRSLPAPPKPGTPMKITLELDGLEEKAVEYKVKVDFISQATGADDSRTFYYRVDLPFNPEDQPAYVGLGTEVEGCIEPVSYEIR